MWLAVAVAALVIGGLIRWRLVVRSRGQSDAAFLGTPWGTNHDYAAVVCAALPAFVLVVLAYEDRDGSSRARQAVHLDAATSGTGRSAPSSPALVAPHQIQVLGVGASGQALEPAVVAPVNARAVETATHAGE
jgi:hypothetical protein